MNASQYHALVRTVALVDIPAAIFLVACAWIGWLIALNQHVLFFWLGLFAFSSITVLGIAKLYHKTWLSVKKETINLRIYEQQQMMLSYPESEDEQNVFSVHQPVAQSVQLSGLYMA